MPKKKAWKDLPPAPPMKAQRARSTREEPLAWIRGLRISERSVEMWVPLYSFRWPSERMLARGTLKHILDTDDLPPEIATYEDFDLLIPPDTPLGGVLTASEPLEAPRQPKARKSAPRPSPEPVKKRRKRCRDVYDATPRYRCIRRRGHDDLHRDLFDHEWED